MSVDRRDFSIALAAMALVVLASNILVQYPFDHAGLGDYLTWGAFTYPFSFLVTDLSNRRFGPAARGASSMRASCWRSRFRPISRRRASPSPRALPSWRPSSSTSASSRRLRDRAWWLPPFVSSVISSGSRHGDLLLPRLSCGDRAGPRHDDLRDSRRRSASPTNASRCHGRSLAVADYLVKLALAAFSIAPYGALLGFMRQAAARPA